MLNGDASSAVVLLLVGFVVGVLSRGGSWEVLVVNKLYQMYGVLLLLGQELKL